jgi:hypothetical protein
MSRSIGDLELKSLGVTAVPDIKQVLFIWGRCVHGFLPLFVTFDYFLLWLLGFAPGDEAMN